MTEPTAGRRTIEVDTDVYDLLDRTATTRRTDVNGALRYLLAVPAVPVTSPADVDE